MKEVSYTLQRGLIESSSFLFIDYLLRKEGMFDSGCPECATGCALRLVKTGPSMKGCEQPSPYTP